MITTSQDGASAYNSLFDFDPNFPIPQVVRLLSLPENVQLLRYVQSDQLSASVFPGNVSNYSADRFLSDIRDSINQAKPIHLWAYIPLCCICDFCVVPPGHDQSDTDVAKSWVDSNILEAELWLEKIPGLSKVPIGEFSLLGGTLSLIPDFDLKRLFNYYKTAFNFTDQTSIRIEASPDSVTPETLDCLKRLGCTKISFGIQSFNDQLLGLANRLHSSEDTYKAITYAKQLNYPRISGDLLYGLLDQTVESFAEDIEKLIELDLSSIVVNKLHRRPSFEAGNANVGVKPTSVQITSYREKVNGQVHHWPSLGQQYQMREAAMNLLEEAGYKEHPSTYYYSSNAQPENWKSLVIDQNQQHVELGIGLGASSTCDKSEANITTDPEKYFSAIENGELPLENVIGFDQAAQVARSVRLAISSCQPLYDSVHQQRFPNSSLFDNKWGPIFKGLEGRGLVRIDPIASVIKLTNIGQTLVEAIIQTEIPF